jgi:hypothetical protein
VTVEWQLGIVLAVVAAAGLYLARRAWRTWTAAKGPCPGGCGCSAKPVSSEDNSLIPVESLRIRPKR